MRDWKEEEEEKKRRQKQAQSEDNDGIVSLERFDELVSSGQYDKLTFGKPTEEVHTQATVPESQEEKNNGIVSLKRFDELVNSGQYDKLTFGKPEEEIETQSVPDSEPVQQKSSRYINNLMNMAEDVVKKTSGGKTAEEMALERVKNENSSETTDEKLKKINVQLDQMYKTKSVKEESLKGADTSIDGDFAMFGKIANMQDMSDEEKSDLKDEVQQRVVDKDTASELDSIQESIGNLEKEKKNLEKQKTWEKYAQADDFEEKSKYVESKDNDELYDYINMLKEYADEDNLSVKEKSDKAIKMMMHSKGGLGEDIIEKTTDVESMSEDEVKMYNYIYNTQGAKKARNFIDDIAEGVNYRSAKEWTDKIKGNVGAQLLAKAGTGLNQFGQGILSIANGIGNDKALPTTASQYASSMIRENMKDTGPKIGNVSLGQVGGDLIETSANMLPAIVLSAATQGMASGALGASTAATVGEVTGAAALGASAGGNTFNEEWKNGVSKAQAAAYGVTSGISEATMQYALGGISKLGGKEGGSIVLNGVNKATGGRVAAVTSKIDQAIGEALSSDVAKNIYGGAKELAVKMFDEGREEYLQDALDPLFRNITMGEDNDVLSGFVSQDALYSGILGALSGGILEAGNVKRNQTESNVYGKIGADIGADSMSGLLEYANSTEDLADFTNGYRIDTTDVNAGRLYVAAQKHIADGIVNAKDMESATATYEQILNDNPENYFVKKTAEEAMQQRNQESQVDLNGQNEEMTEEAQEPDMGPTEEEIDVTATESTLETVNRSTDSIYQLARESADAIQKRHENNEAVRKVSQAQKLTEELLEPNNEISQQVRTNNEKWIKSEAAVMDENTAKIYEKGYQSNISPEIYHRMFNMVKNAAKAEVSFNDIGTYMEQIGQSKDAYNLMQDIIGKPTVYSFYAAGQNELAKEAKVNMSNEEVEAAKAFMDAVGAKYEFVPSIKNGIVGANGQIQMRNIKISMNSSNRARVVASHEVTHLMKETARTEYTAYENSIVENLKNESRYDEVVAQYKHALGTDNIALIHEEIAADSTETFLRDPDKFLDYARENQSVAKKLIDTLSSLIEKLKKAVSQYAPNSKVAKILESDIDAYTQARDLWYRGIEEMSRKNVEESENATVEEKKFSAKYNDFGLEKHTTREISNWSNSRKIIVCKDIKQFRKFIEDALQKKNLSKKLYLGKIGDDLAQLIRKDTGENVKGYNLSIRADEIRKIAINSHGNAVKEKKRKQIVMDTDEIMLLPDILTKYDGIRLSEKENQGRKVLCVKKEYDGTRRVRFYVSNGKKELGVLTMFAKNGSLAGAVSDEKSSTLRPKRAHGTASYIDSISDYKKNSNKNLRYSLKDTEGMSLYASKDSDGNILTNEQQEFFKNSKVRDDKGNLQVMYHGTPQGGFTVFDIKKSKSMNLYGRGFYFSTSNTHAGTYGTHGENSNDMYKVYLNIQKPLQYEQNEITKKQLLKFVKEIAENEDYGIEDYGYGSTPESVVDDIYGKGDLESITDVNTTCVGDLVESIKIFNRVNKTNYDGIIVPTETIAFYSNQIKNVDNVNPSDNEDIRYSLKDVDGSNLYSSKEDDFSWMDEYLDDDIVEDTASILQEGAEALRRSERKIDEAQVRKICKEILSDIGSQYDLDTLSDNLEKVFSYMNTAENVSYKDMVRIMTEVALPVVDEIGEVNAEEKKQYDEFVRYMLDTPIKLSKTQREEIVSVSDNVRNFMNDNRSHMKFSNQGVDLDSGVWSELVKASGNTLQPNVNEAEMPIVLSEYMNALKPQVAYYGVRGATREDLAYDVAVNIFKKYYGQYALNDKVTREMNKRISGYKKKVANDMVAQLQKENRATIAELKDAKESLTHKILELNNELQAARRENDKIRERFAEEEIKEYKEKLSELQAANREKIAVLKAKQRASRIQDRYRRMETERRNQIRKIWSNLQKKLVNPTESAYVPKELIQTAMDVCTSVDVAGKNKQLVQKLNSLRNIYEGFRSGDDKGMYDDFFDSKVYNEIKEMHEEFQNRNLMELNYNDLNRIYKTMYAFSKQLTNATKLLGKRKNTDAYQKAVSEIELLKKVDRTSKSAKVLDGIVNRMTDWGISPMKFKSEMKRLSGYQDGSVLVEMADDFNDGMLEAKRVESDVDKLFDDVLADAKQVEKEMGKNQKEWIDFIGMDSKGNKLKIPRSMMLSLAMHLENDANARHIVWGGLKVPDEKLYQKGKLKEAYDRGHIIRFGNTAQYENSKLSKTEIEDECKKQLLKYCNDHMTEYEKNLLEASKTFFWDYSGKEINKVSNQLKGYDIARVKKYFPITTDRDFTKTDLSGLIKNGTLEGMGMLQSRVYSKNPIMLESIFDVIDRHSGNVANYVGYAIPVRNFNKIYNTTLTDYKNSVAHQLGQTWGSEGKTYIKNFLADVQGGRSEGTGKLSQKLRGNHAQSVLTFNIGVVIKQATSLPNAAATLGWRNMAAAIPKFFSNKAMKTDFEKIQKYTPLLWDRTNGTFNRELLDIKKTNPKFKIPILTDLMIKGIELMDQRVVGSLWYASEKKVSKEQKNLTSGTDLFYEQVAKEFNKAVMETQDMHEATQLSDIGRNPSSLVKTLFMFKTQPMQQFNNLYTCTAEFHNKAKWYKEGTCSKESYKQAKSDFVHSVTSFVISSRMFSVATLLVAFLFNRSDDYKDEDGRYTFTSIQKGLLKDTLGTMAGILVGGDELYALISSAVTGDHYYGMDVSIISNLSDMATQALSLENNSQKYIESKSAEDKEKYKNAMVKNTVKISDFAAQMTGVPLSGMKKTVNAVTSRVFDWRIEDIYTSESVSDTIKEVYADGNAKREKIYDALNDGTRTKEQLASGIRKALKEKDSRIEEAAELRHSGNTEEYADKIDEVVKDGFSLAEAVSAAESKENELYPKEKKESKTIKGLYDKEDLTNALKSGSGAQKVIDAIMENGRENGKDKTSTVRSAFTESFKESYQNADDNERKKIKENILQYTVDGNALFDEEDFYHWELKYSGKDVFDKIETDDISSAQKMLDETYEVKLKHFKESAKTYQERSQAQRKAVSGTKTMISSLCYEAYCQSGTMKERLAFRDKMNMLRVNGNRIFGASDYQKWNKKMREEQ